MSSTFLLTLITTFLLAVTIEFYFKIKSQKTEIIALTKELADEQKEFSVLSQYNDKAKEIKNQKKIKVLELFTGETKISNIMVVKALGVSSATAFRYLDELEKEGKITQNGQFGRTVFYVKIK